MNDQTASAVPPESRTREFLATLAAVGPRLMGTELEEEARSLVSGFFRGLGAKEFRQEFPVPVYDRGATECSLVRGGVRTVLAAAAVERCPSTDGVIAPRLVAAGDGSVAAVRNAVGGLTGAAVYSSKPGADGFVEAARAGAAAWLEPCSPAFDRIRMAYMPPGSDGSSCPRIKIKASSARMVENALASGENPRVELLVEGTVRESRSANIEFTIDGSSGLPHVLVGAHLDTFSVATGATDNGSGVTAACMIAKTLSDLPRPIRGVRFLFFTGEEDGRRGSVEYVRCRLPAAPPAGVYVNFDVPHGGRPLLHVMSGDFDRGWFESLRSRFGDDLAFARNMRRSSDHYSFYRAGVPCLMPRAVPGSESEDPGLIIHTDLDVLDRVDFNGLQRSIVLSMALVRELANSRTLPFHPFAPLPDEAVNFPDPG